MFAECLILFVIIAITKLFHCYLHYRAACLGIPLPTDGHVGGGVHGHDAAPARMLLGVPYSGLSHILFILLSYG